MAKLDFHQFSDDEDTEEKGIQVQKIKERVILIVGLTGSGKSSIIKSLCDQDDEGKPIEARMSIKSVTKNLHKYSENLIINPKDSDDQYNVTLVDTVGLGDHNIDAQTILRQIIERMPNDLSTIHRVVFCFKMDRLRATMSEELSVMYKFLKMLGGRPENFLICLTFCDILNNKTIHDFWNDLKECEDLPMTKEVQTVMFTSFPNLDECDDNQSLRSFLKKKIRTSQHRVFENIIEKGVTPFHPYEAMIHLSSGDFGNLCNLLKPHHEKRRFLPTFIDNTEHDKIIEQMMRWRSILDKRRKSRS